MIKSQGPPDKTTPGNVGDLYIDDITNSVYECIDIIDRQVDKQFLKFHERGSTTKYIWKKVLPVEVELDVINSNYSNWNDDLKQQASIHLDTNKVKNFYRMFYNCSSLTSVPELDTSNGTNFGGMFYSCSNLKIIPELDTSNGVLFFDMFRFCKNLTSVPELDTTNGTNFACMFEGCSSLTSVPELDTSNGTNFSSMFGSCSSLTSVPELDTSNGTNFNCMFMYSSNVNSVAKIDLKKASSVVNMFKDTTSLTNLKLYNINTSIQIGSGTSWGHLLTVDSLVNTIKELITYTSSSSYKILTLGSANLEKIAGLYCRVLDDTEPKKPMELCESTEDGAITLTAYALLKRWKIQ